MLPSPPAPSALPPEEPREVPGGRCPDRALEAAEPEELRREKTGGAGSGERRTERYCPNGPEMSCYRKEKSAYS